MENRVSIFRLKNRSLNYPRIEQYMYVGLQISNIDTVNSRMEELDAKYWIFIYKFNIQFNIEFNTIIQYLRGFS